MGYDARVTVFDEARALLPWWVGWLAPVSIATLALTTTWIGGRVARWWSLRSYDPAAHWTARARVAFAARAVSTTFMLLGPVLWGIFAAFAHAPTWALEPVTAAAAVAVLSFVGALLVHLGLLGRVLTHPPSVATWLTSTATVMLSYLPLLPIVAVFAWWAPYNFLSTGGALWGLGLLVAFVLALRGDTVHLARLLGLAKPASPRLAAVVEAASKRSGRRPPETWEVRWETANAVAYPLGDRLLFTRSILRHLDDPELEAVAAHELGHLSESWGVKALRLTAALSFAPLAAAGWFYRHAGAFGVWAAVCFAWIVAWAIKRLQRRMEERADAHAHAHQDKDGDYARALSRLHEINAIPAVMDRKRTHPDLYDRLVALGAPPSYPRPAPPPMRSAQKGTLAALMLGAAAMGLAILAASALGSVNDPEDRDGLVLAITLGEAGEWEWGALADATDDADEAIVFYRAAIAAAPDPASATLDRARLVGLYAESGRCDDARREHAALVRHAGDRHDEEVAAARLELHFCLARR